jgi:thiamine kinase-like enzyme
VGGAADPQLAAAVADVPGWSGRDVRIEPLAGGITNRNFRVEVDGQPFVVRLAGTDTELLGVDRAAEEQAGRAAAAAGVGPEVIAFLPQHTCLVTRFVTGGPIPEEDLQREDVLALVVRSIKAIHAMAPIPSSFPVFRIVEDYAEVARARGIQPPPAWGEAHAIAARIEHAFAALPLPARPCHNDLLNANFLRDGDHVWIVDYEYAGMGDPFFDLGNLSINNGLGPEAQETLLRLYFGTVLDSHRARLALMRIVSDVREAMWGVVQQAISTLDVDYVAYADTHFARCLASAADPRFGTWLEDAGGTT